MEKSAYKRAYKFHKLEQYLEFLMIIPLYRPVFKGLKMDSNIMYGESKHNKLDIIYPKNNDKKLPLMIYIHGGGWVSGRKMARRTYCYEWAKKDVIVANIDYSLSPMAQFPKPLQDVLDAVDFLFDNADKYNIDTNRICLAGESAGVYFDLTLNLIKNHPELLNIMGLKFKHINDFNINVNMFNCGCFDIKKLAESKFPNMDIMVESFTNCNVQDIKEGKCEEIVNKISPMHLVDGNFAPTFQLYGTKDELRFIDIAFKENLDKLGVVNEIYKCDGILYGNHALGLATITKHGQTILKATEDFVFKYL